MRTTQFSILDRSRTREGHPPAAALRDTVELARWAERLGYHRFWVAEHHSVPGVAGSAPTVLAAAVASATTAIRVGTGGVMLPNHRPLVVAEQFGVLASLFPGRIDMGLGRSVGFTGGIRRALGTEKDAAEDFEAQLVELLGYFTGTQTAHPQVHARPAEGLTVPAFVLATGAGARVAARAGLALVIGDFRAPAKLLAAIEEYRATFRPSGLWARPYVVISGTVAVAGTAEAARRLLVPEARALAYSRTHGVFPPLRPAVDASGGAASAAPVEPVLAPGAAGEGMSERERGFYADALRGHVHGTEEQVAQELGTLIERSAADEVLVTTSSYDRAALLESFERLARLTGLAGRG